MHGVCLGLSIRHLIHRQPDGSRLLAGSSQKHTDRF